MNVRTLYNEYYIIYLLLKFIVLNSFEEVNVNSSHALLKGEESSLFPNPELMSAPKEYSIFCAANYAQFRDFFLFDLHKII